MSTQLTQSLVNTARRFTWKMSTRTRTPASRRVRPRTRRDLVTRRTIFPSTRRTGRATRGRERLSSSPRARLNPTRRMLGIPVSATANVGAISSELHASSMKRSGIRRTRTSRWSLGLFSLLLLDDLGEGQVRIQKRLVEPLKRNNRFL